jgi:hypothetical protein
MLLWLKCIYQTIFVKFNLGFYSFFSKKADQKNLVEYKLKQRGVSWQQNRKTKIFAVFSINNWETVLVDSLHEMGELFHFSWTGGKDFFENRQEWKKFHDQLNKELLVSFNQMYDETSNIIIFIYASDFSVNAGTIALLKRPNTILVSFCWDDLLYFKGKVKGQPIGISQLSKQVDINLTLSPEAIPIYNYYNAACFFWKGLPIAANHIDVLDEVSNDPFYAVFVGTNYGWRSSFIKELSNKGIAIVCYGAGWKNGILPDNEMRELIKKAPVTLGFSNVGYTKNITTLKGRVFEVPLSGGLLLTQNAAGLQLYFDLEKEILTYRDIDECYEKLVFISKHPKEAAVIRNAGYKKAVETATWQSRFTYLHELINEVIPIQDKV